MYAASGSASWSRFEFASGGCESLVGAEHEDDDKEEGEENDIMVGGGTGSLTNLCVCAGDVWYL